MRVSCLPLLFELKSHEYTSCRSLALASILDESVAAHEELAGAAGVRHTMVRSGWLKAFETDSSFAASQGDFELMRRRGVA